MKITTINSLREALQDGLPLNRVYFSERRLDKRVASLIAMCKEKHIPYRIIPEDAIRRKAEGDHQGVFCETMPLEPKTMQEWLPNAKSHLILALDHIWDPGNLGAIIRNAVCGGVDGILLNSDRSSPLNETVLARSAGTLLHANISMCNNLVNEIKVLKKLNYWVVGACGNAPQTIYDWDFSLPTVLVMGNEQNGISQPVLKQLDASVSIPMEIGRDSLNVASAAAVIIFEACRQRRLKNVEDKKKGSFEP